jgi:histidyl-tRNA synthetase
MDTTVKKVEARKLKGFQDYEPQVMEKRLHIINTVRSIARTSLFHEIATPALEYSDTLLGVGGETDKQVFRFTDNGGRDVSLRFDLTVPFARYVAERHGSLALPFKRMQVGDVWRAEKPQKGRFREFAQCDLDIIGSQDAIADMEIILCFHQALSQMLPYPFTIACGNRPLLSGLIKNILQTDQQERALIIIDKIDKIGEKGVKQMLLTELGIEETATEQLLVILQDKQPLSLSPEQVPGLENELKQFQETVATLQQLTQGGHGKITADLSIARGLGYYTGIVFETTIDDARDFGSICSGGRYDYLCERFTSAPLAGVGGSIGVDRLAALLGERGFVLPQQNPALFIAVASPQAFSYGLSIAHGLRKAGFRVDLPVKWQKLGNQFKHASKSQFSWVLTVGDDEQQKQTFALKNMETGVEERDLLVKDVVELIRKKLF